jgi:hypothetical protein
VWGDKSGKKLVQEPDKKAQKDSVLSKYIDEDFSKIANFLGYSPSQLKTVLILHYLVKCILIYFLIEDWFVSGKELSLLPKYYLP